MPSRCWSGRRRWRRDGSFQPKAVAELRAPAEQADVVAERAFVLAHLSDPHVPTRLRVRHVGMLSKRLFGYLSWRFRRVRIHRAEVLEALTRDLARLQPDHVAVTGDIVNIAQPHEFARAADWLRTLGPAAAVTVVPGNHDAYVAVAWERSWGAWRDFMSSDEHPDGPALPTGKDAFPVVRRRGPVALIGLSTAVPTAPGRASGRVGSAQLQRADASLCAAGAAGLFRVVLLHHPPRAPGTPRHKSLTDARRFERVIANAGAELILHGHEHRFRLEELSGPAGPVPAFGVPSASMLPREDGASAQYHVHHIERTADGWSVRTHIHSYSVEHAGFVETGRLERLLARTPQPQAVPSEVAPGSTAAGGMC
jgi:3',5'-cyclic AMP phosphodiesterase CpdA